MLERSLEPEVMDTLQEALDYDRMDHGAVNRLFVFDLLRAAASRGIDLAHETILDLGAGTARIPIALCGQAPVKRIVAVDASASMLALAAKNIQAASLDARIELLRADAKQLAPADGSFGVVLSNSIVHHIPRPGDVLSEAIRVTTVGGLLFFRDLARPANQAELNRLVECYAGHAHPSQQKLFARSLEAALSLGEVRSLVQTFGFAGDTVQITSDRHWTWCAIRSPGS